MSDTLVGALLLADVAATGAAVAVIVRDLRRIRRWRRAQRRAQRRAVRPGVAVPRPRGTTLPTQVRYDRLPGTRRSPAA